MRQRMVSEIAVQEAKEALEKSEVILYPTDTIYGLGVDALNEEALKKLKRLKGRDEGKPISVLVADLVMAREYVDIPEYVEALSAKFLPGGLTLVLPAKETVPKELTNNGTLGIRIPRNLFCLEIARLFGRPITATSANRAGEVTHARVEEIVESFHEQKEEIALVINGGVLSGTAPSTVLSCVGHKPVILREGAVSKEALASFL